ncbi:MAG: mycofactocin biosynthesis glycosyltransferase MftF [Actinobacteria bacterium]|nr:mycofactocin biosynthesis glycosyltransferase MftF [Actinomycetota bacterium]
MSAGPSTYRLGAGTWRSPGGRVLVGGSPPRLVRLGAAGAVALDAALAGRGAPGATALTRRLVGYGLLDPVAGPADGEVTFVVPTRDGGPALADLVAALAPYGPVIVVDDGSGDGSAALARRRGAQVVANEGERGPAGARNTGRRLARTEFVAFVDDDCRVAGDWVRPLVGLLARDPGLALVAPRVRGTDGGGRLARWERVRSALDLGRESGLVGPGRRVAFVPAAALVARRAALEELGGFDEALRFGEDVDLVWRAAAAGWSVRYAAEVEVRHPPRATLASRARQHFDYGGSAAPLEHRHPGAAAPLRPHRLMLPAILLGGGSPGGALAAALALAGIAAARQEGTRVRLLVALLALEAEVTGGRELARAAAREWLPLSILAATVSRRGRRLALAALAIDLGAATAPDPAAAPLNCLFRLADNAAYAAGVWRGALSRRSAGALLPSRRPARSPS